jgi:uncharacterized protein YfiM (DUF2279 family)
VRRARAVGLALALVLAAGDAAAQAGRPPARRAHDRWVGADKVKHLALSFFVQSMGYSAARATAAGHGSSLALASVVTAVTGVGKEWHDRRTTGFSTRDLAWDAAGAGAATLLLRRTSR